MKTVHNEWRVARLSEELGTKESFKELGARVRKSGSKKFGS